MASPARPVVVKVGGSLVRAGRHGGALGVLAESPHPVVLVPGGGAFADAVRAAQAIDGFDDGLAHRLAVRAMGMVAEILVAARPDRLSLAASADEIAAVLAAGRVPVWMPEPMVIGAPDIAESWTITSDSLAVWLAGRIGARAVLLLKSADAGAATIAAADAVAADLVDEALPAFAAAAGLPVRLIGPAEAASLPLALAGGEAGTRLSLDGRAALE